MNCPSFEKLIALWVEGDLPGREAGAVEEHLSACSPCREFARELRASQAALGTLRQDTVEETVLQGFRARVLNNLPAENSRPGDPRWRYALAASLIVVLAVSVLKLAPRSKVRTTLVPHTTSHQAGTLAAGPAPALLPPRSPRTPKAGSPARRSRRVLTARAATDRLPPSQPLTIKLVTDNPQVVIYWQVD